MKLSWKTWVVLLPGALLGAGVGAVLSSMLSFIPHGETGDVVLQTAGIGMAVGSIILRVVLSEANLRLSAHAGLMSNLACTFLSGCAVIFALGRLPWPALLSLAIAWMPALALTVLGLMLVARFRPTAVANEKS